MKVLETIMYILIGLVTFIIVGVMIWFIWKFYLIAIPLLIVWLLLKFDIWYTDRH